MSGRVPQIDTNFNLLLDSDRFGLVHSVVRLIIQIYSSRKFQLLHIVRFFSPPSRKMIVYQKRLGTDLTCTVLVVPALKAL
jgi:hypothetical protein